MNLLHSVFYTSVPWLVGTATDLLVGGWLVDALMARGYDEHRVRQAVLLTGTSLGFGILGAATAHTIAQRAVLDQRRNWRPVGHHARGLDRAVVDCAARKRRYHCRHH